MHAYAYIHMDQWDNHNKGPIGTGPYRLKEYIPGDRLVMEINDDYWGEKPKMQELEYRVIPDPQALILNLESERYFGLDDVGTRFWHALTTHDSLAEVTEALLAEARAAVSDEEWAEAIESYQDALGNVVKNIPSGIDEDHHHPPPRSPRTVG